jgi:hypothetical protein
MSTRKEFKLNEQQFKTIFSSHTPQRLWEELGEKLGFKYLTIRPHPSRGTRFFTAEIKDDE